MRHKIYSLAAFMVMMLVPVISMAQIGDPGCPDGNCVPIDGGLSALIAVGVGYGVKKYKDYRKAGKAE